MFIKPVFSIRSGRVLPAITFLLGIMLMWLVAGCTQLPATADLVQPTETPPLSLFTTTPTPTNTVVWFPATHTPTAIPTLAASPIPEMRPGVGSLIFSDDFSTGNGWDLFQVSRGSAALGNNTLSMVVLEPNAYISSVYKNQNLGNFYFEITVDVRICSGDDEYGILLRQASPADFYRFSLSCNGQVRLDRIYRGAASSPQPWMFSSAVPKAPPSSARLGVWALGDEMRFFIDDQFQFSVQAPVIPNGFLGVFARSAGANAVTVNFSDLEVYQVIP